MKKMVFLLALVFLLAGCGRAEGGATPAAWLEDAGTAQAAPYTAPPGYPQREVIPTARLELEARSPKKVVDEAIQIAQLYGGYAALVQYYPTGEEWASVALRVPLSSYAAVYRQVRALGDLRSEQIIYEVQNYPAIPPGQVEPETEITLVVYEKAGGLAWPEITWPENRPLNTLQSAWSVLSAILLFLLDVLIWLVVVGGPFVLLFFAARWAWRKMG